MRNPFVLPLIVGSGIAVSALVVGIVMSSDEEGDPPPPAAFVTGCTAERTEQECTGLWTAYLTEQRNPQPAPISQQVPASTAAPAQAPQREGMSAMDAVVGVVAGAAASLVTGYMMQGGGNAVSLPHNTRPAMVQTERPGRVPDVRPRQQYYAPSPVQQTQPTAIATRPPTAAAPALQQQVPAPQQAPVARQATQQPPVIRREPVAQPRVSAPTASRPSTPSTSSRGPR